MLFIFSYGFANESKCDINFSERIICDSVTSILLISKKPSIDDTLYNGAVEYGTQINLLKILNISHDSLSHRFVFEGYLYDSKNLKPLQYTGIKKLSIYLVNYAYNDVNNKYCGIKIEKEIPFSTCVKSEMDYLICLDTILEKDSKLFFFYDFSFPIELDITHVYQPYTNEQKFNSLYNCFFE